MVDAVSREEGERHEQALAELMTLSAEQAHEEVLRDMNRRWQSSVILDTGQDGRRAGRKEDSGADCVAPEEAGSYERVCVDPDAHPDTDSYRDMNGPPRSAVSDIDATISEALTVSKECEQVLAASEHTHEHEVCAGARAGVWACWARGGALTYMYAAAQETKILTPNPCLVSGRRKPRWG